ncbi:MAG: DUF1801 domain-containing protein [Caldilineaceae bacterium]|nr:DUF1801 domain-containing protein [Caldilineaceae bacterium]
MAENKTQQNDQNVEVFLNSVEDERKRQDCFQILAMMQEVTGCEPKMWGDAIIGFDSYTYQYASGRSGEWMIVGFSPRKQNITLYIMAGFDEYDAVLERLGKYKTGKACLYIKRLDDVNVEALRELVSASVTHMRETNKS